MVFILMCFYILTCVIFVNRLVNHWTKEDFYAFLYPFWLLWVEERYLVMNSCIMEVSNGLVRI